MHTKLLELIKKVQQGFKIPDQYTKISCIFISAINNPKIKKTPFIIARNKYNKKKYDLTQKNIIKRN